LGGAFWAEISLQLFIYTKLLARVGVVGFFFLVVARDLLWYDLCPANKKK